MSVPVNFVVVTPVRNEAKYIQFTIDSMVSQTVRPAHWFIVNDGSNDETGQIAEKASRVYSWIRVINRPDRGYRKAGGGVVEAFYEGYRLIENEPWDYVVKLDGDLSFAPDYFKKCFEHFNLDDHLGIGGGVICNNIEGVIQVESKMDPQFHVRGATKIYRRACWREIGGLLRSPGWDTMDEVKANMLGWHTRTLREINLIHYRPTGAAYGVWRDRVKNGLGCYITGYHPLFMFVKCLRRMADQPYLIGGCGLLFGFVKGYMGRLPQIEDKALIKYFRQQQLNRLLFRRSLWDRNPHAPRW